ncbi:MAG: lactate dehydrogenase [Clostridia bacterium]|nr:lactate dehydrogenase [Clostridia bacterium]
MKVKLFCKQASQEKVIDELFKGYGLEYEATESLPSLEAYKALKGQGFDAVISVPHPTSDPEFDALKEAGVKHVVTQSIGFDHFDRESAKRHGIGIHHAVYPPQSVASYAVMCILMAARRVHTILEGYRTKDFRIGNCRGHDLCELTVGIIGTGKIGQCVARRLRGFECRILCYDIYENEGLKEFCEYVSMDELLAKSDIVTLHAFASPENHHLISAEKLALMKEGAYIVNTARGDLIDTWALIDALKAGKLGGAVLDVIEDESGYYYTDQRGKAVPAHIAELEKLPEVTLLQHMAFCTYLSANEQLKTAIEAAYLALNGLPNPYEIK